MPNSQAIHSHSAKTHTTSLSRMQYTVMTRTSEQSQVSDYLPVMIYLTKIKYFNYSPDIKCSPFYLWWCPAEVGGQYLQWEMWLSPPAHFQGSHRGQIQGQCFEYLSMALLVGTLRWEEKEELNANREMLFTGSDCSGCFSNCLLSCSSGEKKRKGKKTSKFKKVPQKNPNPSDFS